MGAEAIEAHMGHGLRRGIVDDGGLVAEMGGLLVVHGGTLHVGSVVIDRRSLDMSGLVVSLYLSRLVVSLDWSCLVIHRLSLDRSGLVVDRSCLSEEMSWLWVGVLGVDGSRGIADGLGHRRLVDVVADPRILLVHLREGRGHRLGVVGDSAVEAAHHIRLGVGHGVLIASVAIANACRRGNDSRPCGGQQEQQAGGNA